MQDTEQLLKYLKQGIDALLEKGAFDTGGQEFRPTQRQALEAYKAYLNQEKYTTAQKLKGFFEIPTGVGKTAVFIGIVAAAHAAAEADGQKLKTIIVAPTTQLLHQTLAAFQGNDLPKDHKDYIKGFAPQLKGKIGLYGDGHKNLKLPITIMTYEAWYDLSQNMRIGSHNVDILISDEAHRGTSDRRIENIKGAFNEHTIQIAFTATAHFDKDKSVEGSHEREIFYKSMRDAVLEGELAAYIQSQRATIRVEPTKYMLTDEFKNAAEGTQIKYRRRLRQRTWNQFALKAFREGRDDRTKDPLTDNAAGFFVDSTRQADELEELLNSDPELQRRAKEQGKKGVAIAIHTNGMGKAEQKRRFEAYQRGEYMAVIGDEKFKEGFDYQPMKTLFDYQRNSLVDKVQILGRGARKWWNEPKQRWEGLTVIDSVIYIGSSDGDEDEENKENALRNSISVKDVLEEAVLVGPDFDDIHKVIRDGGGGGGYGAGPDPFDDDPNIQYITDLDEIYALDSKVSKIRREHWIAFTEEDALYFKAEVERTGLGGNAAFNRMQEVPENLTIRVAEKIVAGQVASVRIEHLEALKNVYKILPTTSQKTKPVKIPDETLLHFEEERQRTGLGGSAIFSKIKNPPVGLTVNVASQIVVGRTKSALQEHIDCLKAAYSQQETTDINVEPNNPLEQRKRRNNKTSAKPSEPANKRIPISEETKSKLSAEVERTKCKGTAIFREIENPPKGLTVKIAEKIASGIAINAVPEHVEAILKVYANTSDDYGFLLKKFNASKSAEASQKRGKRTLKGGYSLITSNYLNDIKAERERTGKGIKALFAEATDLLPSLTLVSALDIYKGKKTSAKTEHLEALKAAYAALPDKKLSDKVISLEQPKTAKSVMTSSPLRISVQDRLVHGLEGKAIRLSEQNALIVQCLTQHDGKRISAAEIAAFVMQHKKLDWPTTEASVRQAMPVLRREIPALAKALTKERGQDIFMFDSTALQDQAGPIVAPG